MAELTASPDIRGARSSFTLRSRPVLAGLAILFALATITYSFAWMYYVRLQSTVELGVDINQAQDGASAEITSVYPDSPAQAAGLKTKDVIVAVNGKRLSAQEPNVITSTWVRGRPGDNITLTIQRPGEPRPFDIQARFRPSRETPGRLREIGNQIIGSYPVIFLVVGLAVLFLRLKDPNAWRLALLFAALISVSNVPGGYALAQPGFRAFLLGYRSIFTGMTGPFFLLFFCLFPARSPLDKKQPWLKWTALAIGLGIGIFGMGQGDLQLPPFLASALGPERSQNLILAFVYGTIVIGFINLAWNAAAAESTQVKRRLRVIVWGAFVGLTPAVVANAAANIFHYHIPFWQDVLDIALLCLFPLSFAYAVVKHRVMEIPVLLRRSARYVLVKRGFGFLLLLLAVTVNVLLGIGLSRIFRMQPALAMSIGGGFGIALAWLSASGVREATQRIDRAFFREAYDARMILQDLAQKVRKVAGKEELLTLVEGQLDLALHPTSLAGYLRGADGALRPSMKESQFPILLTQSAGLREAQLIGEPIDVASQGDLNQIAPELAELHPECLVPVLSRTGELQGLIVLGVKRSEEPYSSEDKQLLGSIAGQMGVALESISLAEEMAKRLEADHRAEQEMEIARAVQNKLLPQQLPPLATLDYAGACIQARAVGGDYYDFLDLGPGRVGFVLADIAGKGISGALLMANLQASLRSMYGAAHKDLAQLLCQVNHLFFKNTESSHYATMFFGVYDDSTRRLDYANCGHNPPLLVRATGALERLEATATVLGLFEQWDCSVAGVQLRAGDVLAIYTDGISEAARDGEEFGEDRLVSILRTSAGMCAHDRMETALKSVQSFSPGEQADDLTLIVGVCR